MKINKFAVVGHPINHTMSPFIHRNLFKLSNFFPQYDILDIENLEKEKNLLLSYDGLNITIPHKLNIINLLSEIDAKAERFGSVNTVKIENEKVQGFTTDGIGAVKALEHTNFKGNVLILGSGGAARAIAFELLDNGTNITIAARSEDKAFTLASELGKAKSTSILKAEENNEHYDVLINATSVGMYPNTNACPATEKLVSRCDAVFDIVYNPQETMLLRLAQKLDKKIVYGMDMLVLQAVVAHELWYGGEFKREDIINLINSAKEECVRLFGGN